MKTMYMIVRTTAAYVQTFGRYTNKRCAHTHTHTKEERLFINRERKLFKEAESEGSALPSQQESNAA